MNESLIRLRPKAETIKLLLVRSGNQCAFPGCTHEIFNSKNELVAECCHIEAALPGGERYNSNQTNEARRSIDNLMFFCHKHHVETNNTKSFTVEKLRKIKANHEGNFTQNEMSLPLNQVDKVLETFQRLGKDTQEIKETIKNIESSQEHIIGYLKSNESIKEENSEPIEYLLPPAVVNFFGRVNETQAFQNHFNTYNCIQISGISGIGKSTFIAHQLEQKSINVLWVDCSITTSLPEFRNILAQFLRVECKDSRFENHLKQSNSGLEQLFQQVDTKGICLVLDALDSNSHELFQLVNICSKNFKKSKLIYSSIQDLSSFLSLNLIGNIKLQGLDSDGYKSLISECGIKDIDPLDDYKLYNLTGGHPYLIKLFSLNLQYFPIKSSLEELENQSNEKISEFLLRRIYSALSTEEQNFLIHVIHLGIPFTYNFLDYLTSESPRDLFIGLQKKHLIEKDQYDLFFIPDFLIPYIKFFNQGIPSEGYYEVAIEYLKLIDKPRVFESWALIRISILNQELKLAKKEAKRLFSALMGQGKFDLVLSLARVLENESTVKNWPFIYYIMGRVCRFQENYNFSLEYYEKGIATSKDSDFTDVLKFERASIITYLSQKNKTDPSLVKDAFYELSKSKNRTIAIQSKIALYNDEFLRSKYENLSTLRDLLLNVHIKGTKPNVLAGGWQILGASYGKTREFEKSFDAYDRCFKYYKMAQGEFGMNTIDGLYIAYDNLGWVYKNYGLLKEAVRSFRKAANLAFECNLTDRYERSLFDFGYHLILIEEYDQAADVLEKHYELIILNNLFDDLDMPFIYSALAFSHWYSERYNHAIELIGLFILECAKNQFQAPVSVVRKTKEIIEFDPLEFFQKKMLILILPENKTFDDFNGWISKVIGRKPELKDVLSSFHSVDHNPKE